MSATASAPVRVPTQEQALAAAKRGVDVFLEAGAGTGKTGVLVARYCDAVTEDGVSPEQILTFTFTEKAAAELRRRIRAELERRAEAAEGDEATRLADAVRSLGAAPITTIHGFCRRLLASHPVAAGLDPRFRVLDEAESKRVAWTAFDTALEDYAAEFGEEGERLIAAIQVRKARNVVLRAHEELVSRGDEPALPPVTPRPLEPALAEIERTAAEMAEASVGTTGQKEAVERARAVAANRHANPPGIEELEAVEPFGDSKKEEVAAALTAIRSAVTIATENGPGIESYLALADLLRIFAARFAEAKTERSGLDFEDLQRQAVGLLSGSAEIGASYRDRFAHVMVDEFQDTNALQLKLIEALRGRETRLFCVGDAFQSIYGFRHADVGIFTAQRDDFAARVGAETMRLSGNFRSRPQIIAAVNRLGTALMDDFEGAQLECGRPAGDDAPAELLITEGGDWDEVREEIDVREGDRTQTETLAEARGLALRLRELVDSGAHSPGEIVILLRAFTPVEAFEEALARAGLPAYVVGGGGYWSRQQAQDMVSLLGAIANPLDDEALLGTLASPAGGVSPDTLWLLRRAAGRRNIWRAVRAAAGCEPLDGGDRRDEDEPDEEARRRAAERAAEQAEALSAISEPDLARITRLEAALTALQASGPRLPLDSLIARAVEETGYDLAVLRADHGRERYANVRKMMRLARDFEAVEGRDLRGFLDYAALSAEQDAEAPAAVESEEGEGVRVMTIHAAKGLEFPVVAVAGLGRPLRIGADDDLVLGRAGEDPLRAGFRHSRLGASTLKLFDYEDLVDEASDREEAEELRLAYVAATRARERLILSGIRYATNHTDPRSTSIVRRLLAKLELPDAPAGPVGLEAAAPIPQSGEEPIPDARLEITHFAPSPEEARRLSTRIPPLEEPAPEPDSPPPLVSAPTPALPSRTLSYSMLSEHARCGYRFYVERVLRLGSVDDGGFGEGDAGRDRALQIGNATHELLRRSAENRWALPGSEVTSAAMARHGLEPGDEEARQRVAGALEGWLGSELPHQLRGGGVRLRAEHPFLLDIDGTIVRGDIDLLAERAGRPPLVIDYKTDKLRGDAPIERAERYATQRNVYATAVAESLGVDEVEVSYVFLERPGEPATTLLGADELAAARESLRAGVAKVAAGSFKVTPEPDWPLCSDCPARRRLCPSPAPRPEPAPLAT